MNADLSFGMWLKRRRRGLGMTQVELGRRTGYSGETIRKVEAEEVRVSRAMADALVVALDIPPGDRERFLRFARNVGGEEAAPFPADTIAVPPTAPPRPRHNLPTPPTPLVGRDAEVAALTALLQRDTARLVTLTGVGGSGKTRLALDVAFNLLDGFEDGVFFVDLAPVRDPALVLATIARTLDVRETAGRPLLLALQDVLRDKSLLLLLDNFEQALDAGPMLADLLAAAPHLKLLVTSREVLHLRAEHVVPVEPLAVPPLRDLPPLDDLAAYPAVALFAERASDARPDFHLTADNGPAVAEVCTRLDGLPLAIELAAARVRLLPPTALLSRLGKGLTLVGPRDLPPRQQTLHNTIAWSYALLSAAEKALFRRLSVFVGGATLEAVEAVCNVDGDLGSDVMDGVAALVDKSLLRQVNIEGEARFTMLETIREFAVEELAESGEADALRRRHATCFVALAEQVTEKLYGPDQLAWMDRLDAEQGNLRVAVTWAAESGRFEMGLRIGGALREFFRVRGPWQAWRDRLADLVQKSRRKAQAAASDATPVAPVTLARACLTITDLSFWLEDYADGRTWARETMSLTPDLGPDGRLIAAWMLVVMAHAEMNPPERRRLAEEALSLVHDGRSIEECTVAALALLAVGQALQYQQDYTAARPWFEAAMARFQELGNPISRAFTAGYFGLMLVYQGEYTQAREYVEESLAYARRTGNRLDIARNAVRLGHIMVVQGRVTEGEALLTEGLAVNREVGNLPRMLEVMNNLGELARRQGDYARALPSTSERWPSPARSATGLLSVTPWNTWRGPLLDLGRLAEAARSLRKPTSGSQCELPRLSDPFPRSLRPACAGGGPPRPRLGCTRAVEVLVETVDVALPVFEYADHPRVMAAARAALYRTAWEEGGRWRWRRWPTRWRMLDPGITRVILST
ncbi:MAG: tetratricopeptide repeat protein [Anaerolineae bacterium]